MQLSTRAFFAFAIVPLLAWRPAAGETYYVNAGCGNDVWSGLNPACAAPDGPKATIQSAIVAAGPGDTILVAAGEYRELVDFLGKDVVVRSTDGPAATVINAQGGGSCVKFRSGETTAATIEGFTLVNGTGTGNGTTYLGGGVSVFQGGATIRGNIIRDNSAEWGGGIDVEEGEIIVVDNLIEGNLARDSHLAHLTGNGGGISVFNAQATIEGNTIVNNRAALNGGGVSVDGSVADFGVFVELRNNMIAGNTADARGGGVFVNQRAEVTLQGSTLSQNVLGAGSAFDGGHAIAAVGPNVPTLLLQNAIVYGNGPADEPEIDFLGGSLTVRYTDVRGGQGGVRVAGGALTWGAGNTDVDPLFVDAEMGDFHLAECSPVVNAGDPAFTAQPGETDVDGDGRVLGVAIDMGADEVPHVDADGDGVPDACACDPCDANCDGTVDSFDIEPLIALLFGGAQPCSACAGDANGDGTLDSFDIEAFVACLFGG